MPIHSDTLDSFDSFDADAALRDRIARDAEIWRLARILWDDLMTNGGFTFRVSNPTPTHGYMVGDGRSETVVKTCTVETVYRFLSQHWERVIDDSTLYFGGWATDDAVYLDISEWWRYEYGAKRVARERGELAIFDLANGVSIDV